MIDGPCGWNDIDKSEERAAKASAAAWKKNYILDRMIEAADRMDHDVIARDAELDVERPAYYAHGIEPIDYMRSRFTPDEFRGYLLGSAVERLARLNARSASAEVSSMDIREAAHFLDLLLDFLKSQ